jgi:hypothetical protein
MKLTSLTAVVPLLALIGSLAACGGGGDAEAGSLTALSVVPTEKTLQTNEPANGGPPVGQCNGGYAGEFFIYGGAAPYRLDNTASSRIYLSKTQVGERGGSFSATFLGGCFDPASIIIVDSLDRQVILTLKNLPAQTTTTAQTPSTTN